MPPIRSPAELYGSATQFDPYQTKLHNKFKPELEGLDPDVDEEYRARVERDPYGYYQLRTGMYAGMTLEELYLSGGNSKSYVEWMEVKFQDFSQDHVMNRALRGWLIATGRPVPPLRPVPTLNLNPTESDRFKDSLGKSIWIMVADLEPTFQVSALDLKRAGLKLARKKQLAEREANSKYYLYQVYEYARQTKRPVDEPLDTALDRYLEKVNKCAKGFTDYIKNYCECQYCSPVINGATREGERFKWIMLLERSRAS